MPFLRLEAATPTETEKTIVELKKQLEERDREIEAMKETVTKIQPLVEFVNSFDTPQKLKTILEFLKEDYIDELHDGKFEPTKFEFSPYIFQQLKQIAKAKGITEKEALEQLVRGDLKTMKEGEERWRKLEEQSKKKPRTQKS